MMTHMIWYLTYFGIPLAVGFAVYKLSKQLFLHRRCRAVLQGKVSSITKKKVVVITGASSGLGEALAHAFYDQGSKVVLVARRANELARVRKDLQSKKMDILTQEPVYLVQDLAKLNNHENVVETIYKECGTIDILINNAALSNRGCILHSKIEVFERVMAVNYFGSVALTKAVLPRMVERKSGHIVLISSVQGLIGVPDRAPYVASKHAIQGFGDCLRAEIKQHNINVTVVNPGYIKTAVSINALTETGTKYAVTDKNIAAGFSTKYVAEKILKSIVNKDNELVVSQFLPKVAIFLRHFAPSVYFWIMEKIAAESKLYN